MSSAEEKITKEVGRNLTEELQNRLGSAKRGPLYEEMYWRTVDRLFNPPAKVVSEYNPYAKERMP